MSLVRKFLDVFKRSPRSVVSSGIQTINVNVKKKETEEKSTFMEKKAVMSSDRISHEYEQQKTPSGYLMTSISIDHPDLMFLAFSKITNQPVYAFIGKDFNDVAGYLDSKYVTYTEIYGGN
jgi:hypothetical protein